MPASDPQQGRRGGRLFPVLFWSGVGLAPLAALLLVLGDGSGGLRVAAILAVLSVLLIGLSITLRRDGETVRAEVEDVLFEEIDILRDDVRADITTAARATHKALGDRVAVLTETVDALRGQVDALRVQVERGLAAPPPGPMPVAGVARPVAGAHGVVRHTETVKVTRQTIVDPNEGVGPRAGTVYGSRTAEEPERAAPPPRQERSARADDPPAEEESWTEQLLRRRFAESGGFGVLGGIGRRHAADDGDDDRVTGVRAGDRWASVRSDEHGRELRMGERRAAVHAHESGTELRIEDRWAAVRRREFGGDDRDRDGGHWSETRWETTRDDEPDGRWTLARRERRDGLGAAGDAPLALPAASSEPVSGWSEALRGGRPEALPERVLRRSRLDDDEPRGYASRRDEPGWSRTARDEPERSRTGRDEPGWSGTGRDEPRGLDRGEGRRRATEPDRDRSGGRHASDLPDGRDFEDRWGRDRDDDDDRWGAGRGRSPGRDDERWRSDRDGSDRWRAGRDDDDRWGRRDEDAGGPRRGPLDPDRPYDRWR